MRVILNRKNTSLFVSVLVLTLVSLVQCACSTEFDPESQLKQIEGEMHALIVSADRDAGADYMIALLPTEADTRTLFGEDSPIAWGAVQANRQFIDIGRRFPSSGQSKKAAPELIIVNARTDKVVSVWAKPFIDLIPEDVPVYSFKTAGAAPSKQGILFVYVNKQWRMMVTFMKLPALIEHKKRLAH